MEQGVLDTGFGRVEYIPADDLVLLTWKKFCCFDDYRRHTLFGLELLKNNPGSNFVIDARNGFEDEKEDVEWGFAVLLPAMAKTGCHTVVFVMNEVTDIEEEMDLWSAEFGKYFAVKRADSYPAAVACIKQDSRPVNLPMEGHK